MFADLALPSRICPKTPGRHSLGVGGKSAIKLSKIAVSFGTKQNSTFVINLTKIGSTLSPEEHRLHAWAGPLVAGFKT